MRASLKTLVRSLLGVAVLVTVAGAQAQLTNLVPRTKVWRYQTNCQTTNGWETAAFDDSAWPSGAGGFTGGETTAALLAQCTTTNLPAPNAGGAGGRPNYFRTHFNVASTVGLSLTFSNAVDDGARVFLNGTEIFSLRGPTTNDCPAFSTGGAPGAGTDALLWEVVTRTAAQLSGIIQTGDNVLAVSVHQTSATSSDLLFAQVVMGQVESAPTINYAASSLSNRTVRQCRATTLSVVASAAPAPTFQWIKNGLPIFDATNASYTITNMQASDAADYYVQVSNALGSTNSTPVTMLSYAADTSAPAVLLAWASVQDASNRITVVFDEPLDAASATTAVNYSITDTNTGLPAAVLSAVLVNSTTVALTVTPDLQPAHGYALLVSGVADACANNAISPAAAVPVSTYIHPAIPLDAAALWKYDQSGVSLGTAWIATSYNDAAWLTGAGSFDAKRTNATSPLPLCRPVLPTNGEPVRTCLTLSNATSSAQIPTSYFRKRFLYSDGTNGAVLRVVSLIDDGAVYYLNGVELTRIGMPAGTISYGTLASRTVTEPAYETNYFLVSPLLTGLNTFAVELHQVNLTSSDLTFGMQLDVLATAPPAPLAPAIFVQPRSVATASGNTAVFLVDAGGTGPFTYQWHVNCRDIRHATNATLVISNVTPADVGTYSVTVAGVLGQTTSADALLALTNAPVPVLEHSLAEGSLALRWTAPLRLQESTNLGNVPFSWTFSEANVGANERHYFARSPVDQPQKFFRLFDSNIVRIINHPIGRSLGLGQSAALQVGATAAFTYQWRLNGRPVEGGTNASLPVTLTNQTQYGAYQADVADVNGLSLLSRVAVLRPDGNETALSDSFEGRALFISDSATLHGTTFAATRQAGEPEHAALPGGKSVWLTWQAQEDGVVTFDTIGSGFDTLLAAYAGTNLAGLTPIASDDDAGGNLWSRIQFNAVAHVDYTIALDGLVGAGGFYALNWSFTPTADTIPIIVEHPEERVIDTNAVTATAFNVVAQGLPPLNDLTYQWYFNDVAVAGAAGGNNPTLFVGGPPPSVPLEVGTVYVVVSNQAFGVRSRPATLQFSTDPGQLRAVPKLLQDFLCTSGSSPATNCCGGSFALDPKKPAPLLATASGTLTTSLSPGTAISGRTTWVWMTNGFSCNKTATFTATVKVGTSVKNSTLVMLDATGTLAYVIDSTSPRTFAYNFVGGTSYIIGVGHSEPTTSTVVVTLSYTSTGGNCP